MKTLIIAEAGVNHNGSLTLAKKLVDAAVIAQVDYVKFQIGIPELVTSKFAPKANYQKQTTGEGNQLDMIKKISLTFEEHAELKKYCDKTQVKYLCTPFDLPSIDFLESLHIPLWKIPSGEITNYPYLKRIAQKPKTVILSTGMSTMEEIKEALNVLVEHGIDKQQITVLHCNTQYPTPMQDVNLLAMQTIAREMGVKTGYSDHTLGIEVPIAAVALGATVIEKHFTLNRNMEGPDHKASLEPDELKVMVAAIRNVEMALGSSEKKVSISESENINIARKSIVASRSITKGETFTEENLTVKRPGNGISPMHWEKAIGGVANRDYNEDELIERIDSDPLISVIIPVYNVESEYLVTCIESVLNQTYRNLEILLIDDKSTDSHIVPILRQFKNKDSRIVLIEKKINEGASFTRQQGIDIAKGKYLFFIDCDDYITHDCIKSLLDEAEYSKADMVIGDHWRTYKTYKICHQYFFDTDDPTGYVKALLTRKCGGTIWNKLIKTEKIRPLELPNIYMQCNDVMVNFFISNKNFKIKCLGKPLYNWVQRESSVTQKKSKSSIEFAVYIVKWVNDYVLKYFNSINLENELAYYNLSFWALLLACGLKKPFSCDVNNFRNNVYNIYWINKWAKNQLSIKSRLIVQLNQNDFLAIFYKTYAKFLKPLMIKK